MNPTVRERLHDAYLDAALEETLDGSAPPDLCPRIFAAAQRPMPLPSPTRRGHRQVVAAAVFLLGSLAVAATLWSTRNRGDAVAAQDPDRRDRQHPLSGTALLPLRIGDRRVYAIVDRAGERRVTQTVTARLSVDGRDIHQLRTADTDAVEFSYFWTADDGLYRMPPWLYGSSPGLGRDTALERVVAAPVGVEAFWSGHEDVGAHRPERLFGESTTGRPAEWQAELLGADVPLTVPAGNFATVHVRSRFRTDDDDWIEECWYAPGVGLVQRVVTRDRARLGTQRLLQFTPAAAAVDRTAVLDAFLAANDAAPQAIEWLALQREACVLRSAFACVTLSDGRRIVRVLDDDATWFEPTTAADHQKLLQDEGLDRLRGTMFTQALAEALASLTGRLTAAEHGERDFHGPDKKTSTAYDDGARETAGRYAAVRADGTRHTFDASARVKDGRVLAITLGKR